MAATDAAGAAATWPIERLQPADAEGLCPLSIEAGWNQVAADWRLMLTLGQGFGVRGTDGRWIASALSLPLGRDIAWLSMVLVTQPARGQGLGTRLLSRCLAEVEASGAAAGLDATELGRPIYLPLRLPRRLSAVALARPAGCASPRSAAGQHRGARRDVGRPRAYLRLRSPTQRISNGPRLLADLLSRAPALARVAERADGSFAGYALGRDGYRALHIGPVVADDEGVGLALLSSAARRSRPGGYHRRAGPA